MAHAVALVMIDIVKSRTIHRRLYQKVGTKADAQYDQQVKIPCRQRVTKLLAEHSGILHGDVGDLFTAHFDHTQDAVAFALALQRLMSREPIAVPDGCACPHLQLHVAVGCGSMENAAYHNPGSATVGAFNELARILAITGNDQTLVTVDARDSAGEIDGVTWHEWDVVLPKEQDRVTVLELLWDGRKPRRPKDMAAVSKQALKLAEQNTALAKQTQYLEGENLELKAQLTAALERVQARADTGDLQARAAIDQARQSGDLTQLDAALDAEWARRETQIKALACDSIDLCRESAAVAFTRGDIEKAKSRWETILRFFPDDLDATNSLGWIYELRGDLPAAERQYNRVLDLAGEDESWRAKALGDIANIARTRGELDAGEKLLNEALSLYRKLGRLEGQASDLGNLGIIAGTRGDLDAAENLLNEALTIYRKLGHLEGQANQLSNLGQVARTRGDLDAAEKLHNEALAIYRKLGHLEGKASNLGNLGIIAQTRGALDAAEELYNEALAINRKLGSLEGQASALGNLGIIARTRGDLDAAEKLHNEALAIVRKLGSLEGQASILGNLGVIAETRGDLDAAEKLYNEALAIYRKLGSLEGQASNLGNLGIIARKRGDLDAAEKLYNEAMAIDRKLGSLEGQAITLQNLGIIAKRRKDFAAARRLWTQSRDFYATLGAKHRVEELQGLLDGLPPE